MTSGADRSDPHALLRVRWAELRTAATGVDPGLVRLRLATAAVVSMLAALGLSMGLVRLTGQPVTVLILAAALAMIGNIAVNEPDVVRLRVTTGLLVLPAAGGIVVGTLLSPHRVIVDAAFVAIMMGAVWVRRFGPRWFALGMAAVMACFFSQLLNAAPAQLPWLLVAAALGIGATLLVRGFLFAERPERTLTRLVRAFRARVHALVTAVAELLDTDQDDLEHVRRDVGRRRARLGESALLIGEQLERQETPGDLGVYILDAELAAQRLADTARHLVVTTGRPVDDLRLPLLRGLQALGTATATGISMARSSNLLDVAQRRVAPLVARVDGLGDDGQRVAFAVTRLAGALAEGRHHYPTAPADELDDEPGDTDTDTDTDTGEEPGGGTGGEMARVDATAGTRAAPADEPVAPPTARPALAVSTRQAVQVGIATGLAIVAGELLSPARWYWAVIAAFVVFAGTTSRGDVLARGLGRIVGTIGGVGAGMALAFLVDGSVGLSVVLLFVCLFLAVYLVRVSPGLLAFWITAVLALVYGLTGQFSVATLVLRIEETAVGAALGMISGYLVLPTGTRDAFGEALDAMVDAVHAVLDATFDRILGRLVPAAPVDLARDMDAALGVLRDRARPLDNPLPSRRGRSSYARALRILVGVDHYARLLARLSDTVRAPDWAATVTPAVARIRENLDGLRALLLHVDGPEVVSAEPEVNTAEANAARHTEPELRAQLLLAARLLRRMDQAVVGFAADLGAPRAEAEVAVPYGS